MGQYTAHGYLYKPSYGETGRDTTSQFNAGLDLVDAYMAGEAFSAPDFGTSTLAEIVAAIGSDPATIYFPSSTININENTTVPATVNCIIPNGGILHVATDVTLTINGHIDAGPYQIFSWTGTGAIDLSGSPVVNVPLDWFGAESGTSNDCAAALTKVNESVGINQTIFINPGVWRIASSVDLTKDYAPIRIKGHSKWDSQIYIDVGAGNIGITVYGDVAHAPGGNNFFSIEDISLVGPATCCDNALKVVECHDSYFHNFNSYLGSTSYAVWLSGCVNVNGDIAIRRTTNNYLTYGIPNDGILVDSSTTPYQANATTLRVDIGQTLGIGLNYDGTNYYGAVCKFSGIIENCVDYTLKVYNNTSLRLVDFYTEAGTGDILLDHCRMVTLNNFLMNISGQTLKLHQCQSVDINNYNISNLFIRADCRNVVMGPGTIWESLVDDAPDTLYTGRVVEEGVSYPSAKPYVSQFPDRTNLIYNSSLSRWSSTDPDGFTHSVTGTISQENTIVHGAPYSLKMITQGASSYDTVTWDASAAQLRQALGKFLTVSWWIYAPVQANLPNEAVSMIVDGLTLPARANSTAYKVNDAVIKAVPDGTIWTCIVAGTTDGSPPTYPAGDGDTVTDGTVTWVRSTGGVVNTAGWYSSSDAGVWKRINSTVFVPNNATAWYFATYFHDLSTGGAATYYAAEPTVLVGRIGPSGYIPSQNESPGFIQIGANRISYGTAVPASGWCQQGDIVWRTDATSGQSPGWICTASGTGGGTAVWKAFANVGA